jgi:seryl-tRNA synthetase
MLEVRLEQPVPREHQVEILKNLYWVDAGIEAFEFDPADGRRLRCRYAGSVPAGLDERVRQSAEKLARSLQLLPAKVAFEMPAPVSGCAAPYEALVERGWVTPASTGTHCYSGLFLELLHALDDQFRREALRLGTPEHQFPSLIPLDTLEAAGYLAGFPHNANFICHLPEHAEAIDAFKARMRQREPADPNATTIVAGLARPDGTALSPTVCYHFYQLHAGRTLPNGALLSATALSPCYRFEGRAMRGLRRLREFNMREIIYLGSAENVQNQRTLLLEVQRRMLERAGLHSVVRTASDPFFLDDYDKKRLFQLSFDLKYEVQAWLPADEEWLAIGSVNYHQDHFGQSFGIRLANGDPAHSCCLGFGLDRWGLAIFAQHGLEPASWPAGLQGLLTAHRSRTRQLCDGGVPISPVSPVAPGRSGLQGNVDSTFSRRAP